MACNHIRSIEFYIEAIKTTEGSPVAHVCPDYQSYLEGKCAECHRNASSCVILGPQSLNYLPYVNKTSNVTKKFYMITDAHSNYFRK